MLLNFVGGGGVYYVQDPDLSALFCSKICHFLSISFNVTLCHLNGVGYITLPHIMFLSKVII